MRLVIASLIVLVVACAAEEPKPEWKCIRDYISAVSPDLVVYRILCHSTDDEWDYRQLIEHRESPLGTGLAEPLEQRPKPPHGARTFF